MVGVVAVTVLVVRFVAVSLLFCFVFIVFVLIKLARFLQTKTI